MPEAPNNFDNYQGGSSDYWDGFRRAYWDNREEMVALRDSMSVSYGGHGNAGTELAPQGGLRFAEDSHAAGSLIAGELIKD